MGQITLERGTKVKIREGVSSCAMNHHGEKGFIGDMHWNNDVGKYYYDVVVGENLRHVWQDEVDLMEEWDK